MLYQGLVGVRRLVFMVQQVEEQMESARLPHGDKASLEFFQVFLNNKASTQWKPEVRMVGYLDGLTTS